MAAEGSARHLRAFLRADGDVMMRDLHAQIVARRLGAVEHDALGDKIYVSMPGGAMWSATWNADGTLSARVAGVTPSELLDCMELVRRRGREGVGRA